MSDFHPAIVSLSLFAWKRREIAFCFPFLMSFLWISAKVLRLRPSSVASSELTSVGLTHVVSCVIASLTGSLRSFNILPFKPRLRAVQTSAHASPSSIQSASFNIDSCTRSISLRSANTTQGRIHFDHREDNAEGAKNGLGRCDAAEFLCKIGDLDGHIERGEDNISTLLSVGSHGSKVDVARGNVVVEGLRGRFRTPIKTSGNRCSALHSEPFKEETAV